MLSRLYIRLIFFVARLNMGNAGTQDFMASFKDFGRNSWLFLKKKSDKGRFLALGRLLE